MALSCSRRHFDFDLSVLIATAANDICGVFIVFSFILGLFVFVFFLFFFVCLFVCFLLFFFFFLFVCFSEKLVGIELQKTTF